MDVVVTGIGLVSALGNLSATWHRLLSKQCGIQFHQPFSALAMKPLALIGATPADFLELTQQVVTAAIEDAELMLPLPDCGVVIGSSRSQQATWERLSEEFRAETPTSPWLLADWLATLPHQGAIAVAHHLGATGTVLAPMAACATGLWAISQGFELVRTGQCQQVLAGAVETPITPLTITGFERMGALAQTGAYPFDRYRQGLVLGEAAAVLVLESVESARNRNARIYGKILGFGLTADGYHVSAPEVGSQAAAIAVQQCLQHSHLTAQAIDYIHAHGTATQLNDQNEALLIQQLFPKNVAVSSTKGATGHTIGASGALGAAFCLMALKTQMLPPCLGLKEPAFDLNFVTEAKASQIRQALCLSFGFGGQNAAISLQKWDG